MQKRRGGFSVLTLKKRAKKNAWQGEEESSRPHVQCTEWICPHIPTANLGRSQQEHLYNLFWGSLSVEIYLLEIQKIRNAFKKKIWISIPGYSVLIFSYSAIVFTNDVYQNNPQLLSLAVCESVWMSFSLHPPPPPIKLQTHFFPPTFTQPKRRTKKWRLLGVAFTGRDYHREENEHLYGQTQSNVP